MKLAAFSAQARLDSSEAAAWIRQNSPQAARQLRERLQVTLRLVAEHPRSGTVREEWAAPPFRFARVNGTPYWLVYDCEQKPPVVLRVIHGARDIETELAYLRS